MQRSGALGFHNTPQPILATTLPLYIYIYTHIFKLNKALFADS